MANDPWEAVFVTADPVEAEIVKGLLESHGFPVIVKQKGMKQLSFMLGSLAPGDLVLLVPPDQAEAAADLLAAAPEESAAETPDDEA